MAKPMVKKKRVKGKEKRRKIKMCEKSGDL
jgi:hypothetical protein